MTWEIYPYTLQRDIAVAVNAAAAGSKVAAGNQVLRTAFTGSTRLKLIRDGITVFDVATGAPFEGPSSQIQLAQDYSGAATTLANADIDTGVWYIQLENGSNVARNRVARTGQPFVLSDDLVTTSATIIGYNFLTLPTSLDASAPPDGSVNGTVEAFISQMTSGGEGVSRFYSGGSGSNAWTAFSGEIICPTRDALYDMVQPPYQGDMFSYGGPDLITPWIWCDLDQTSTDTSGNSRLEVGGCEIWGRNKTTGVWSSGFGRRRMGIASRWNEGGNTLTYADAVQVSSAVSTMPGDFSSYGLEFWPEGLTPQKFNPAANSLWIQAQDAFHIRALFRRGKVNPVGSENRANYVPRVRVGFDFHCSAHPNMPGTASSGSSAYGRPEQGTWVGYAMDGGSCSWHLVPFNGSSADQWYSFGVTTIGPQSYPYSGWRPLWAAVAGKTAYSQFFPWSAPPWTVTHQDYRNNPAPLPTGV